MACVWESCEILKFPAPSLFMNFSSIQMELRRKWPQIPKKMERNKMQDFREKTAGNGIKRFPLNIATSKRNCNVGKWYLIHGRSMKGQSPLPQQPFPDLQSSHLDFSVSKDYISQRIAKAHFSNSVLPTLNLLTDHRPLKLSSDFSFCSGPLCLSSVYKLALQLPAGQ